MSTGRALRRVAAALGVLALLATGVLMIAGGN
jgi:hypothetical protein